LHRRYLGFPTLQIDARGGSAGSPLRGVARLQVNQHPTSLGSPTMTIEKRPHAAVAIAFASTLSLSLLVPSFARADDRDKDKGDVKHVLLISVDGMHEVDLQRYV